MLPPALVTDDQRQARARFRRFADAHLRPHAERFDREERLPPELVGALADEGWLGALVSEADGGTPLDMVTYGFLNEEIGAACSSTRSLLTVHGMVTHAIQAWGSPQQKRHWLPQLASGRQIGAFALTEPAVGSDARSVETRAERGDGGWTLRGRKRWITCGQVADVFLILATSEKGPVAFLVEAERLTRTPMAGLLGTRAAMLAELVVDGCVVADDHMLSRPGFGFTVIGSALDIGRFSVAWGCTGIAQACLEACEAYSRERRQFGRPLAEHALVARMLTDMMTGVRAARLLCLQAAHARQHDAPSAVVDTLVAKYHASTTAMRIAADAVQIHGANGCGPDYPVARYLRDAKVMEIIEGSTEIQQGLIARHAHMDVRRDD